MSDVSAQDLVDYVTQDQFLNTPYVDHTTINNWGPGSGWDCSSFTSYVMKKYGVTLPAYSDAQYNAGTAVEKNDLRPGDLVFFHYGDAHAKNMKTGHVGIYIGGGKIVNAANPSAGTRVQAVDWNHYVGARRVLNVDGAAKPPASTGTVTSIGTPAQDPGNSVVLDAMNQPVARSREEIAARYGANYAWLSANPKLKKWFDGFAQQYVDSQGQVSYDTFKLGFDAVPVVANHDAAWLEDWKLEQQYPKLYEQKLNKQVGTLRDVAATMGANLSDDELRQASKRVMRLGLNQSQIQDMLSNYVTVSPGTQALGNTGVFQNEMSQWVSKNGLNISTDALASYAQKVSSGDMTTDDVKNDLRRTYLVGMYPAWADKIEAGHDPADLFSPYLESAKALLEDKNLSLSDPVMAKITQGVGADGKPVTVPLYEAQKIVRQDPRWQKTDNAYKTYADVAQNLLKTFGFA